MLLHQWYQSPVVFWPVTGEVIPGAPVNIDAPTIAGPGVEGTELLCDEGFWTGTEPIAYEYQWYQVEEEGPPTPPVAGSPVPSISGSTTRGATLHVTPGTWSGSPAPTYSYQWMRLPSTPVGTNSANYVTVVADVGSSITCTVTATNASGTASQAASNSRGPITEPVPGASLTDDSGELLLTDESEELTT